MHGLLLVLMLITLAVISLAPALVADISAFQIGNDEYSWMIGNLVRAGVAFVYAWALLGVRAMHPLTTAAHCSVVIYLAARISEIRFTHDPFTVMWAALMLALFLFVIRTITRPNEYELAQKYQEHQHEN